MKILAALVAIFLVAYFLPLGNPKIQQAIQESFRLLQWYARNHTLACIVPALFIAGAIITFLSQSSVMRYLGPKANPILAYGVASVAGCVLAVCSCSVLPMFAGIYQLGAGLGPASAFLYSGPAINVLAIFLSARVLGLPLGVARAVGAVVFSVAIGLLMAVIFRKAERAKIKAALQMPEPEKPRRHITKTALYLGCMIMFLIFSDWFNPGNVTVTTADGRTFNAVVLNETKDAVRFQLEQDLGELKAGDKITLSKPDIARTVDRESWVMTVYHIRWYLAGLCASCRARYGLALVRKRRNSHRGCTTPGILQNFSCHFFMAAYLSSALSAFCCLKSRLRSGSATTACAAILLRASSAHSGISPR